MCGLDKVWTWKTPMHYCGNKVLFAVIKIYSYTCSVFVDRCGYSSTSIREVVSGGPDTAI